MSGATHDELDREATLAQYRQQLDAHCRAMQRIRASRHYCELNDEEKDRYDAVRREWNLLDMKESLLRHQSADADGPDIDPLPDEVIERKLQAQNAFVNIGSLEISLKDWYDGYVKVDGHELKGVQKLVVEVEAGKPLRVTLDLWPVKVGGSDRMSGEQTNAS